MHRSGISGILFLSSTIYHYFRILLAHIFTPSLCFLVAVLLYLSQITASGRTTTESGLTWLGRVLIVPPSSNTPESGWRAADPETGRRVAPCRKETAMKRCACALVVTIFGFAGCLQPQTRLQSDEEGDREKEAHVQTIGDVTTVANAEPIPVSGVGLVVNLDGTGGGAPPGSFRRMLEDFLHKKKVENVKDLLASTNNAMVLVSGLIPAGARIDD